MCLVALGPIVSWCVEACESDFRNETPLAAAGTMVFSKGSVYFQKLSLPLERNVFTDMFWAWLLW